MTEPSRRSGTRSGLIFLLIGVVVAALLFAGDRVALRVAEGRVSERLQADLGLSAPPAVDIKGFPFLTQLVQGSLHSVNVVADDVVPQGPQTIALKHVDLTLTDVTSSDRFRTSTAAQVEGNASMDYATLQQLTNQPLTYAREDRVELSIQTQVISVPVTAKIVGRPVVNVAEQTFTLADAELTLAGVEVPETTSQALLNTLLKPVPITGVPFGLSIVGVAAQPDGLVASLTGDNITFSQ